MDATVGGHVELGQGYSETAIAEVFEETGLSISSADLHIIDKRQSSSFDEITKIRNNAFRTIYGYVFEGDLNDLVVESDAGAGFKAYPLQAILNPTPQMLNEIIPQLLDPSKHSIYRGLEKLVA